MSRRASPRVMLKSPFSFSPRCGGVNPEPQEESASSYEQRPEDQKHDEDGHLQLQMLFYRPGSGQRNSPPGVPAGMVERATRLIPNMV